MRYPKEKDIIIDRLRTIARERGTFTVGDCIGRFGLGQHNSNDWAECADGLIAKGELLKTGDYHEYKVVKKEETMETKMVYKVVRLTDKGLRSALMGNQSEETKAFELTYEEGKVTTPKVGKIIAFSTIENAKDFLLHNPDMGLEGQIWEAETLDAEPMCKVACFSYIERFWLGNYVTTISAPTGTVGCSAIKLIKRVGMPKIEEWVDVTKECALKFLDNYPYSVGGTTVEITHCGSFVARLGIGQPSHVGGGGRYKIEEVTHNYIGQMSTFKVLKKVV